MQLKCPFEGKVMELIIAEMQVKTFKETNSVLHCTSL